MKLIETTTHSMDEITAALVSLGFTETSISTGSSYDKVFTYGNCPVGFVLTKQYNTTNVTSYSLWYPQSEEKSSANSLDGSNYEKVKIYYEYIKQGGIIICLRGKESSPSYFVALSAPINEGEEWMVATQHGGDLRLNEYKINAKNLVYTEVTPYYGQLINGYDYTNNKIINNILLFTTNPYSSTYTYIIFTINGKKYLGFDAGSSNSATRLKIAFEITDD